METANVDDIVKIAGIAITLLGVIGTLITVISTAIRSQKESDAKINNDQKVANAAADKAKVDLAEKTQEIYEKLLADMEEKFKCVDTELDGIKEAHKIVTDELGRKVADLEKATNEINKITKENKMLRNAGLLLIRAIDESLQIRQTQGIADAYNCGACLTADSVLLKTLTEVKVLFENGDK